MDARSIENERQNKPTLIVRDLAAFDVPPDAAYEILLRRGVFKWLSARRRIIRLKDDIKREVTLSLVRQRGAVDGNDKAFERGYRKAKEEDRASIRAICHSPRWQAPDFDRDARRWLTKRTTRDSDRGPNDAAAEFPNEKEVGVG